MDIEKLKNMSSLRTFKRGDVIIADGDSLRNEMYILLKGRVGVYKHYQTPYELLLSTLEAGDFFGEMTLFLNMGCVATVAVLEEVTALEINRVNAYDFFEKQPEATYSLIKTLCGRIDGLNNKLSRAKNPDAPVKQTPVKQTPAAAPRQQPEAKKPEPVKSALFPKGHKAYAFTPPEPDGGLLTKHALECPFCGRDFKHLTPRPSKLILEKTDNDFRPRHKGIDTLFFETATCPDCLYSAFVTQFGQAVTAKEKGLLQMLSPYKGDFTFNSDGAGRDLSQIFASLYLALIAAPFCFTDPEIINARLWMRLSWMYADCGDAGMEAYAIEKAREEYIAVFERVILTPAQVQQINIVIGELSYKLGELETARKFYFQAKTSRDGAPVHAHTADARLTEIKERLAGE